MKNLKTLTIVFLLIFASNANTENYEEHNNQKISVSLHPMSLFLAPLSDDYNFDNFVHIYLTAEIPLNLSNSFIILPSLWLGLHDESRIGSGIGVRHFITGKGEGFYLQAMSGFYRYSIEIDYDYSSDNSTYKKGFYGDLLGYIGYSYKNNGMVISFDMGIGTLYPNPNIVGNNHYNLVPALKKYLLLDFNFSVDFLTFFKIFD